MFVCFDWMGVLTDSPIMLILLGCSVITFGVALERLVYYRQRRGDPESTTVKVRAKLRECDLQTAAWLCEENKHPMGAVATQVLRCSPGRPHQAEEQLQIALSEQKLMLEKNLGILGTMAAIAPLIGLLGTVWGIMRAFHDMALTGSAAPAVVAAGVAEALVTTAAGLVIAVPSVLLYNHFCRRMNVMLIVAENHARNLRAFMDHLPATSQSNEPDEPASYGIDFDSLPDTHEQVPVRVAAGERASRAPAPERSAKIPAGML
jgi:biopolymer transport protein ExbB